MGNLKNKALKNEKTNEKKFTLDQKQLHTLLTYRAIAQRQLDNMLQEITTYNLYDIAINQYGYESDCVLEFKLDIESKQDNLIITEIQK